MQCVHKVCEEALRIGQLGSGVVALWALGTEIYLYVILASQSVSGPDPSIENYVVTDNL